MEIKTKYNIGDEVWAIVDNEIQKSKVFGFRILILAKTTEPHYIDIVYSLQKGFDWVSEDKIFSTKQELINSL